MTNYDFDNTSLELGTARDSQRNYREEVYGILDAAFEEMVRGYDNTPFGKISQEAEARRLSVFLQIYEELEAVTQRIITNDIKELQQDDIRQTILREEGIKGDN